MAEGSKATAFRNTDKTLLGGALVSTGKGIRVVGSIAGMIPFGVGSAAEMTMGMAGVATSAAGDKLNNDPLAKHNAVKGAGDVTASATLNLVPGAGLANLAGRAMTKGWKAPTEVLSEHMANAVVGDPKDIAPLGTPSHPGAQRQKKPNLPS